MKSFMIFLFKLSFIAGLVLMCDSPPPTSVNEIANPLLKKGGDTGITVSPSGDVSGVTDADNIQDALNAVKADGGTVHLTDGKYYVSRNIVVEGFRGTLKGKGMDKTIIEAVRQSPSVGFEPAESAYFPETIPDYPTVLQLDYAAGDVTIRDLTVQAVDNDPVDPYLHPWVSGTNTTTAISTLIEILGGDHNTVVENVRLKGALGDARGMNVVIGIHVMLGEAPTPGNEGTGDLRFKNVVAEDIGLYGLVVMRFESSTITIEDAMITNVFEALFLGPFLNSSVTVEDVRATNVGWGVDARWIYNSSVVISNVDIALGPEGRIGIYMWDIPSGLEVTDNTVTGSARWAGVEMDRISNATIVDNTLKDVEVGWPWGALIFLWQSHDNNISKNHFEAVSGGSAGIRLEGGSSGNTLDHNHFVKSGLPGWTATTPDGPGAILLDESTYDNTVFEMKFPPGKGICQMIWDMTDDPGTTEYDGANEIHNWRPCENLAERVTRKAESESESGFHRRHEELLVR